jgi:hypothetical protein
MAPYNADLWEGRVCQVCEQKRDGMVPAEGGLILNGQRMPSNRKICPDCRIADQERNAPKLEKQAPAAGPRITASGFDNGGFSKVFCDGAEIPRSLIAAAQDLLAQLKHAIEFAERNGGDEAYSFLKDYRAAIAKAEGR